MTYLVGKNQFFVLTKNVLLPKGRHAITVGVKFEVRTAGGSTILVRVSYVYVSDRMR
jgi:hypothetical protein